MDRGERSSVLEKHEQNLKEPELHSTNQVHNPPKAAHISGLAKL